MFQVQGVLKVKNNEVQVSDRFKKREFVLTIDPSSQYPQHVQFQLVQDKCSLINDVNVGEEIKVSFNLRGREWSRDNDVKYFNTLDAWRIERAGSASPSQSAPSGNMTVNKNISAPGSVDAGSSGVFTGSSGGSIDDIPF
jgi:hypothetical protein